MEYKKRIIDDELDLKMEAFGATLIVGPKGCGKTTSAKQKAKSFVEFQDEEQRENLLAVAAINHAFLTNGRMRRNFGARSANPLTTSAKTDCISSQALPQKKSILRIPERFASANSKCIP